MEAAAVGLQRLGLRVEAGPDWLVVHPAHDLHPGTIEPRNDHRVAMAFSVLGVLADGIAIEDPGCVAKSFPGYWQEFERFCAALA